MSTETTESNVVPPDELADSQAVIDHVLSGKPLDPEVAGRVPNLAAKVTQELRRTHGTLEIGVAAIRKLRDTE